MENIKFRPKPAIVLQRKASNMGRKMSIYNYKTKMMKEKIEQIIDRNTEGNYLLSSTDKAQMVSEIMDLVGVTDSLPIEFLEWTEKGMWTKWENRNDGYHEMTGWYNTHNFAAMEQPLSSQELFELFMLERSKR